MLARFFSFIFLGRFCFTPLCRSLFFFFLSPRFHNHAKLQCHVSEQQQQQQPKRPFWRDYREGRLCCISFSGCFQQLNGCGGALHVAYGRGVRNPCSFAIRGPANEADDSYTCSFFSIVEV